VHRQTACWAVKHMALGVVGFGCEDALVHLMNYVWPNIFEKSPHMMQSFNDAVEGFRVSVGPARVMLYTLQVSKQLFNGGRLKDLSIGRFFLSQVFILFKSYTFLWQYF